MQYVCTEPMGCLTFSLIALSMYITVSKQIIVSHITLISCLQTLHQLTRYQIFITTFTIGVVLTCKYFPKYLDKNWHAFSRISTNIVLIYHMFGQM